MFKMYVKLTLATAEDEPKLNLEPCISYIFVSNFFMESTICWKSLCKASELVGKPTSSILHKDICKGISSSKKTLNIIHFICVKTICTCKKLL